MISPLKSIWAVHSLSFATWASLRLRARLRRKGFTGHVKWWCCCEDDDDDDDDDEDSAVEGGSKLGSTILLYDAGDDSVSAPATLPAAKRFISVKS